MGMKFAPSAWKTNDEWQLLALSPRWDGSVSLVATVNSKSDKARFNARLIAASPEMYELLNHAFLVLSNNDFDEALRLHIDECLSRIKGCPDDPKEEED